MDALYRSSLAIVFQGRAEEVLPRLEERSVHLIVTDPPYGCQYQSNRRHSPMGLIEGDDGSADIKAALLLGFPALARMRHLYVFGTLSLTSLPVCSTATLVWDKCKVGMGNLSLPYANSHETIQFAVKRDGREAGTLSARLRHGSVLRHMKKGGTAIRHPTEKPVGLMRQLIESSSQVGETVLDPYAGSGSTLVAAIVSGRRAVGIEVDPGYCHTMVNRIKEAESLAMEMSKL